MPDWTYGRDVPNTTSAPLDSDHFQNHFHRDRRQRLRILAAVIQGLRSWRECP